MAWTIEFHRHATRDLDRIATHDRRRILRFLKDRVAPGPDPRALEEALRGRDLGGFWKYRVGDYRLVCDIQDHRVLVVVVRVGHRREVYRQR